MRTAGNIITVTGFTVFVLAGCSLDSVEPYGTIALMAALAGIITTYLRYRMEEIADYICWNRLRKAKQRRKHRKVKMWLDRAQQSI